MIRINQDLAYWVGVAQTDGSYGRYKSRDGKTRDLIRLTVSPKSSKMLNKFKQISEVLFQRNSKIFKMKTSNHLSFKMGAAKLLSTFKISDVRFGDPPRPPEWAKHNPRLFGSYLAGTLDGDGSLAIIHKKTKPQLVFRVFSGHRPNSLKNLISNFLGVSVNVKRRYQESFIQGRPIVGRVYILYFYLNLRHLEFFKQFVLPHMQIDHKRKKLEEFISIKNK
jgi:hypothetical protein